MTASKPPRVRSHRDLMVWQKSIELVRQTYALTEAFPKREMYGIVAQMRRAAVSIPANIAEGQARRTTKDYARFLVIATGSLRELETYREVSIQLQYVTAERLAGSAKLADEIGAMLARLLFALRRRASTGR